MNVFVIPSWYPSSTNFLPGRFVREQTLLYAGYFSNDHLAISHWGQNDNRLLLESTSILDIPGRIITGNLIRPATDSLSQNCVEYFSPAFTWTRRIKSGNIGGIISANLINFQKFQAQVGSVDLIHAHVGYPGGFIAMQLSRAMDIPYLVTEHMGPFPFPSFKTGNTIDRCLIEPLQKASKVLAVSSHLKEILNCHYVTSEVYHNFIDDDFFQPNTSKIGSESFSLLHVGRLAPEKDHKTLILAVKQLRDLDFELRIVGEGPLRKELEAMVITAKLSDKVHFIGELDRKALLGELLRANVLVMSSTYENCPLSVLEALASGKPVISTKIGGAQELISTKSGLLVDIGDVNALAVAMRKLVKGEISYTSESIRKAFMRDFGSRIATHKLRAHYESVMTLSNP